MTDAGRTSSPFFSSISDATHLLESGTDIRTVQEQPGNRDVKFTKVYTRVLKRGVRRPLSDLNNT